MTRQRLVFDVYIEDYASTRCVTSAAYDAHVSYHLLVIIFSYKYSVANNFMFHLC
jgi:hypothetical protein